MLAPPIPGWGCDDPSIADAFVDQLSETLNALDAEGVSYNDVATVENLDLRDITVTPPGIAGVPIFINGVPILLVGWDRDVILVRSGIAATPVIFPCAKPSVNGCNFDVVLDVTTPVGPINIERGFVAVDATIDGTAFRFTNTHLEIARPDPTDPLSGFFQAAQAFQLIRTLAVTTPLETTLLVVGDINSDPRDVAIEGIIPPYAQFVGSGYVDSWASRPAAVTGFTCCQLADLSNRTTLLDERVDMVFTVGIPSAVLRPRVLGDAVSDKTPPRGLGIWPSDHGGVAVDLVF